LARYLARYRVLVVHQLDTFDELAEYRLLLRSRYEPSEESAVVEKLLFTGSPASC
jgi:hypothetical protein